MTEPNPVQLTAKQERMKRVVAHLTRYMETYSDQVGYLDYSDETFINDVLYGLGIALDDKYRWSSGFDKFKERLVQYVVAGDKEVPNEVTR